MSYFLIQWWYRSPIFWEIFFVDRIAKIAAFSLLDRPFIINKFLSFQFSINRGIAWSFFSSGTAMMYFLITLATAAILVALGKYAIKRQEQGYEVFGETLILAGGFSNFVDRLIYHGVVDFIKLSYGRYVFPIFNVADIVISMGVFYIFHQLFFSDDE